MLKKDFNRLMDEVVNQIGNTGGVCSAFRKAGDLLDIEYRESRWSFEKVIKPLTSSKRSYWLGLGGEKHYRTYMAEWFRWMANEHRWYRKF